MLNIIVYSLLLTVTLAASMQLASNMRGAVSLILAKTRGRQL